MKILKFALVVLMAAAFTPMAMADDDNDTMLFGYAGESASSFGYSKAGKSAVAMEITGDELQRIAGSKIKSIKFEFGPVSDKSIKAFDCFITENLSGTPLVTVQAPIEEKEYGTYGYKTAPLPEPFEIKADQPIFVGFGVTQTSKNGVYPYAFDYVYKPEQHGDWMSFDGSWKHGGEEYGSFCIWIEIEGNALPVNDMAVNKVVVPTLVRPGKGFMVEMEFQNNASNPVTEFYIQTQVGDEEPTVTPLTPSTPLEYGGLASVKVARTTELHGNNIPFSVKIMSVNGVEDTNNANDEVTSMLLSLNQGEGYPRNVLVEEFTGTWCGYCPRGYVGMEQMRNIYDDGTFIPVCVHFTDPMACPSYMSVIKTINAGWPTATLNRHGLIDPNFDYLDEGYSNELSREAFAKVDLTGSFDEASRMVTLNLDARFATADAANYRVAYVMTQDSVGPYAQQNYYSTGKEGEMGGFEKLPASVDLMFNDVALELADSVTFFKEVVPSQVYTSTHQFFVPDGVDIDKVHFVGMVLNCNNGYVENAAYIKDINNVGITEVIDSNGIDNAPIEFFNIQGQRTAPVRGSGVLIRRQGNKATKIIL